MSRFLLVLRLHYRFAAILVILSVVAAFPLYSQTAAAKPSITATQATKLIQSQPYFVRNDGQADSRILYEAHGLRYSAFLTRDGATLVLPESPAGKSSGSGQGRAVRLSFQGMNPGAEVTGADKLASYSNYFSGSDPKKWQTRVPEFARVRYKEIYPGIDAIFYIRDGRLEYDFAVAPGANAHAIRMNVEGAHAQLTPEGDVVLQDGHAELIRLRKPQAEQPGATVAAKYSLRGNDVSLALGQYDRSQPLLIDPALVFSTFLTSNLASCPTAVTAFAVNSTGIYAAGTTCATNFPFTSSGPSPSGGPGSFVVKLDLTGSHVVYSTFLNLGLAGGNVAAITVDGSGAVYIAGDVTVVTNFAFPTTPGAYSPAANVTCNPGAISKGCATVGFATKLGADGATLAYSTLIQPKGSTTSQAPVATVTGLAIDASGALYLGGSVHTVALPDSSTTAGPLAVSAGAFQTSQGNLFALKLNPTGSALDYATYLDGTQTGKTLTAVAVDSSGAAYLTGSAVGGYPTTPGALLTTDPAPSQGESGFVTKLSADGSSQVYSTYIDPLATGDSRPLSLALDSSGEAVVAGTNSPSGEAFVSKLNASGSAAVYANHVSGGGANGAAVLSSVAVDTSGAAYVAGWTRDINSLVLLNPIQGYVPFTIVPGELPVVAASFDNSGTLVWSTFLGNNSDIINTPFIGLDGAANAYLLITPDGLGSTPGSIDSQAPAFRTNMLVKIAPSLGSPQPLIAPGIVLFANTAVGTSSTPTDVALGNFGDASLAAPSSITTTGPFSQTNNCTASVPGGQKCDINVVFAPTSVGPQTGTLVVNFGGTPPTQTIALSGTATVALFSAAPNPVAFSPQAVGVSGTKGVVITNVGTAALSVSGIQATGDFTQTNTCSSPVSPNATCSVQVTFTPSAAGFRTGSLIVTDNTPSSPDTVPLTGFGGSSTSTTLNPSSLTFGPQAVGITSSSQNVTLSNTGSVVLAINSISASGDFAQSNNCGSSVNTGSSCQVSVTFTPSATGNRTGTLTIIDNTTGILQTVSLSGTGASSSLGLGVAGGGSASSTISAGATANYSLSIGGLGMSGTATFTCTGAPAAATCTVPSSMAFSSSAATTFTASVTTTARTTAALRAPGSRLPWAWAVALMGIVVVPFAGRARRSRTARSCLIAFSLLALAMLCSCGGGGSSQGGPKGTPPGTFTLTVTATSGSTSQSTNLTLTVQ